MRGTQIHLLAVMFYFWLHVLCWAISTFSTLIFEIYQSSLEWREASPFWSWKSSVAENPPWISVGSSFSEPQSQGAGWKSCSWSPGFLSHPPLIVSFYKKSSCKARLRGSRPLLKSKTSSALFIQRMYMAIHLNKITLGK